MAQILQDVFLLSGFSGMSSDPLACPLCSQSVSSGEMAGHLRLELDYAPWRCRLCNAHFHSLAALDAHWHPRFSQHLGKPPNFAENMIPAQEERILDLLSEAKRLNSSSRTPRRLPPPLVFLRSPGSPLSLKREAASERSVGAELMEPRIGSGGWGSSSTSGRTLEMPEEEGAEEEEERLNQTVGGGRRRKGRPRRPRGPEREKCRECGEQIRQRYKEGHASAKHLRQSTFSCGECEFRTQLWCRSAIQMHMSKHGFPNPSAADGHFTDHRPELREDLKLLVQRLFPK